MPLLLTGLSHKTAPLAARERLASLPAAALYEKLRAAEWNGAVVLSTCNRFEVVLSDDSLDAAGMRKWLTDFMSREARLPLAPYLYCYEGAQAAEHLFRVASGLDSLVPGEAEILGQVKSAYETAHAAGTVSKTLHVLFQRAFHVGKSVRTRTAIAAGQTSAASVAVVLAERVFGDLSGSRVLILGAGAMAELAARHLMASRVRGLYIANRTPSKATELARRFRGEAALWEGIPELLTRVDIVIASTGSARPVVTTEMVRQALLKRNGRPLLLIDIAMPRDVEEGVQSLKGVCVCTLDDLRAIVEENLVKRRGEFDRAAALVCERAEEFGAWLAAAREGKHIPLRHSSMQGAPSQEPILAVAGPACP